MSLSDMKISTKLRLGFGISGLILVLISTLCIIRVSELSALINLVINDRYQKVVLVGDIQEHQNLQARYLRNAIIAAKDKEAMERWLKKVDDEVAANTATLDKLTPLVKSPKGIELLNTLKTRRDQYGTAKAELIKLLRDGKVDAAGEYLLNQLQQPQLDYFNAANALVKFQEELMQSDSTKMEQDVSTAIKITIAFTVIALVTAVATAVLIGRSIAQPLAEAVAMADRVSHGDLTTEITSKGRDEIGQLIASLKDMQQSLVKVISNVRHSSESVATASSEIAQGNNDLSSRTEQQASALEETAASMEQQSATVKQNADSAQLANKLAHSASDIAVKGGDVVNQVVSTMKDINDSSRKIAEIISVIDGIAFQTNILALNAAVEAARAGEQGRGFAVVASEVRTLAGRSAEAAKEIKALINASVEKVEHGSTLVDQAGSTMSEVVQSIRRVTDLMGEISSASTEQARGVSQVGEAVAQMDQVTQQNAALVEEMAAAATSLKGQAQELVAVVSTFKLNGGDAMAKVAVRSPVAKPFQGEERRALPSATGHTKAAPKPAPRAPHMAPPKATIKAKPQSLPTPAPAPVQTASAKDDDWETF